MSEIAAGPEARPLTKKRRPWLAGLLSLLIPGLGQVYNGQYRRGLAFLVIAAGADALLVMALIVPPAHLLIELAAHLLLLCSLLVRLVAGIDAFRQAGRVRVAPLGRFNRWYIYILAGVAWMIANETVTALSQPYRKWHSYHSASDSMLPTLRKSDYWYAWKGYYESHQPERGDIAVFKLPRDGKTDFIKRIVGLPGDRVRILDGVLEVNGNRVTLNRVDDFRIEDLRLSQFEEGLPGSTKAPHRIVEVNAQGPLDNTPLFAVPEDHYFVLGDNRDNSLDSRVSAAVGYIPRSSLRDRPIRIYWSDEWRRIGRLIEP